jgi:hypothetical protein
MKTFFILATFASTLLSSSLYAQTSSQIAEQKLPPASDIAVSSAPQFGIGDVKPHGTNQCKYGSKIGPWAGSPCSKIYGEVPPRTSSTGQSSGTSTYNTGVTVSTSGKGDLNILETVKAETSSLAPQFTWPSDSDSSSGTSSDSGTSSSYKPDYLRGTLYEDTSLQQRIITAPTRDIGVQQNIQ